MSGLKSATLKELDRKGAVAVKVQFNPNTLSIQMQNSTDGARSHGRQKQQYNGSASVTLNVDLEFDSTDVDPSSAGATSNDVRRLTEPVRAFMIPRKKGSKASPPRVCFSWGTIEVRGTMESLKEDLTYFSKDGVPLQAKLTIQIRGQEPKFEANQIGPGAKTLQHVPPSGSRPNGANPRLDTEPPPTADSTAEALSGETPADFLSRAGLPPEAWRAVSDVLDDDFELPAGIPIDFSGSLSLPGGTLLNVGVDAQIGIDAASVLAGRSGAGLGPGFALSAAGGVSSGSASSLRRQASLDNEQKKGDFGISAVASGHPMLGGTLTDATDVDRRAASFGAGVPLREVIPVPDARSGARFPRLGERAPERHSNTTTSSGGCHRCDPWSSRRYEQ